MATFLKNFFLVKKYTTSSKYAEGGGGEVALRNGVRASLFKSFLVFYISDKIYQIGVLYLKNFHFSLSIFKNGVKKRSKNPILHDSLLIRDVLFVGHEEHPNPATGKGQWAL